jgi:alpha-tubulin suppressor-like RCC1 family protein
MKPVPISALSNIIKISSNHHHSLVLNRNGDVYSFGSNKVLKKFKKGILKLK